MKTVTTRRVIRPAGGPDPVQPIPRATPPAMPALQPKKTMWSAWLDRFAAIEKHAAAAVPPELVRLRSSPRQADMAEARRLQDALLTPWSELQETFEVSAMGANASGQLIADYRSYLDLRANLLRAMVKRCLIPSASTLEQLDAAEQALQRFVAARRTG